MVSETLWTNEHGYKSNKFEFAPYIEERINKINQFSRDIASSIPIIRKVLKSNIKLLREEKSYSNLAAIDGSNTRHQKDPYLTTFSVNAIAYLQFQTKKYPARFLKKFQLVDVPTSNFSNVFMYLKRDILEMETFLTLTDIISPDVVFMDGSINSQAIWNARVSQLKYDPYVIQNATIRLYNTTFNGSNGLWEMVISSLQSIRIT